MKIKLLLKINDLMELLNIPLYFTFSFVNNKVMELRYRYYTGNKKDGIYFHSKKLLVFNK